VLASFEEVWNVVPVAYRRTRTPDEMLGRAMSSFRVIAYGAFPVGALLGGVVANVGGLHVPFFGGAVIMAALLPIVVRTMSEERLSSG
jgi:MFS family permease